MEIQWGSLWQEEGIGFKELKSCRAAVFPGGRPKILQERELCFHDLRWLLASLPQQTLCLCLAKVNIRLLTLAIVESLCSSVLPNKF